MAKLHTKRIAWIDNIRAFAIILVILEHSLRVVFGGPLVRLIIAFDMPLFVIISGYCAFHNLASDVTFRDFIGYTEKVTKHILLPAFMGTIFVGILHKIEDGLWIRVILYAIANVAIIILYVKKDVNKWTRLAFKLLLLFCIVSAFCKNPYWFLTMIWTLLVSFRLLTILLNHRIFLITFVAFVVAIICSYYFDNVYYISEFFLYFIVGLLLKKHEHKIHRYYLIFSVCLLIGVETYFLCGERISFYSYSMTDLLLSSDWHYWIMRQVGAVCWCVMFIMLFRSVSLRYSNLSSIGGGDSWYLYSARSFYAINAIHRKESWFNGV